MEKREPSYTAGKNINWNNGKQYGVCSKKRKAELPNDPQFHSWAYTQAKTKIQKDTCIPIFTTALFTTDKTWKRSKCPLTDEWIKMCYTWTQCNISHKKNEIIPFAAT